MTAQHTHESDRLEHFIPAICAHVRSEMNVDVPNEAAAPIGDGEMTRWACTKPSADLVRARAAVPIAADVKARPSSLAIATTLAVLLLAVASFVAALVVSLVFLPAAVTFAAFAVHLTLATIPGIKAGFKSENNSFGIDTRVDARERA